MFPKGKLATKVKDVLPKANAKTPRIRTHDCIWPANPKGATAFQARYGELRAYALTSGRFNAEDIVTARHEWADRNKWHQRKDPLWWSCICKKELATQKRTVRSSLSRRLRNAFVESLKKHGYDSDGSRLQDEHQRLYGTLQLVVQPEARDLKHVELVKQTDRLVEKLRSTAEARRSKLSQQGLLK